MFESFFFWLSLFFFFLQNVGSQLCFRCFLFFFIRPQPIQDAGILNDVISFCAHSFAFRPLWALEGAVGVKVWMFIFDTA